MDPDARCVLFATEGRDSTTVQRFAEDLKAHGGYPELIGNVTCDMSAAFMMRSATCFWVRPLT